MVATYPEYQDVVSHKSNEASGVVIAVYEQLGIKYFDVRNDDNIYYKTLASNWVTTTPCDKRVDW